MKICWINELIREESTLYHSNTAEKQLDWDFPGKRWCETNSTEDNFKGICISLLFSFSNKGIGIFRCEIYFYNLLEGPVAAVAPSVVTCFLVRFDQLELKL